jgi:hypothetical protein
MKSPEALRHEFAGEAVPFQQKVVLATAYDYGLLPDFAVRKKTWLGLGRASLEAGNVDPLQFLMMTSALVSRHEDSRFDRFRYLDAVIRLYNDSSLSEDEKIVVFTNDIVEGSKGKISKEDLEQVFQGTEELREHRVEIIRHNDEGVKTYSAISKDDLWPLMVGLYKQNYITFEQVGLVLTVNLHSMERRRSGERYLDHPMAVAEGYLDIAPHYLGSDAWQMVSGTVSALMHDTGEGSNYIPKDDYAPLMPDDVVGCICRLHKKPESPYFKYIQVTGRDIRTALVKLCDLFHNCSDAKEKGPSFKQKYVYPIAAAYLQACLSDSTLARGQTVKGFSVARGYCSADQFDFIERCLSEKKELSEVGSLPDLQGHRIPSIEDIEEAVRNPHAHTRRDQVVTLHAPANV